MTLDLDVTWIHGARDCRQSQDPLIQTHQADETTFIFRQSKCSNFEAPFMYLLIGATRSLLVDTGAAIPGSSLPIRSMVDGTLARHTVAGRAHPLIVAHSHAHADHAAGTRGSLAGPTQRSWQVSRRFRRAFESTSGRMGSDRSTSANERSPSSRYRATKIGTSPFTTAIRASC
jgi:hypothetical protein